MADKQITTKLIREYGDIILTLTNVLLPQDKVYNTPSLNDGLSKDNEYDLRIVGCELIQTSGILLRLPQVAMATGQVLFQRFYHTKSFINHNMEIVSMACINLASKIEESPRRIRDVVNVFHHIKQMRNQKVFKALVLDSNYINLKNQVIKAERRILKELGFCVHVKHPHKIIVMFLQVIECEKNQRLVQKSWNYMNDSFRANMFVSYSPETIACACIYLAARKLKVALPNKPSWYQLFNVTENDIISICKGILELYKRHKPNVEKLEDEVARLKKIQLEVKAKSRGAAAIRALEEANTPTSTNGISPKEFSPTKNEKPVIELGLKEHILNNQLKAITAKSKLDSHSHSNGYKKTKDNGLSRSKSRHRRSRSREASYDSRSNNSSSCSPSPYHSRHRKYRRDSDSDEIRSRDKYRSNRRRSRSPQRKPHRNETRSKDRKMNRYRR